MGKHRVWAQLVAGASLAGLLTVGVQSASGATTTARSSDSSSASGQTVTIWTVPGPNTTWQQSLVAGFEHLTGDKVVYDSIPETAIADKEQVAQEAHSSAFSIFENSQSGTSTYKALDGVTALNSYIDDPTLTPSSYDFNGISKGELGQCTLNGVVYCLPVFLDGGPQLFWNKAMFKAAGIASPPSNWAEIVADAQKLNDPAKDISGYCMRGSETGDNFYPFLLMYPYFAPYAANYQGEVLNHQWVPDFNTPGALAWATDYQTLMTRYAPSGVSSYGYEDCEHAFQNGQTAMWLDDSSLEGVLASPQLSKEANVTGYDEIPCPAFNPTCLYSSPWGMYINPNIPSAQKLAAWEFLEYLTSSSNQIKVVTENLNPNLATRASSLDYVKSHAAMFKAPLDFLAALAYSLNHVEPNAVPTTPAWTPMLNDIIVMLSSLTESSTNVQQELKLIQKQLAGIVAQDHLN